MYYSDIKDIENPFLANAAFVLSLREDNKGNKIYKFRSLYIDHSGECAISYYGRLTEQQIKEVMINFCYPMEDKSYDEITPQYNVDYHYENGHHYNGESEYTIIFTPDGLDYRNWKDSM
jgi:hypothetical protein